MKRAPESGAAQASAARVLRLVRMGAYVLAICFLKDVGSRPAWTDWQSATPADAGLVHGGRGLADAGSLWRGRGAGEAKDSASAHRDARAHQHSNLYRDSDGDSDPDAEAQTYHNDTAAPAAAPTAAADPYSLAAHRYARHRGNGDGYDHC